jgi:hypothetical protein
MIARITLAAFALLSLTGCVAAIPMAAQLISGANPTSGLCSIAKLPGQSDSLCDRLGSIAPAQAASSNGTTVNTASR